MSSLKIYTPTERMALLQNIRNATTTHNCPECKRPTYCSMEEGESASLCWCMTINTAATASTDTDTCLCRDCLTGQNL